MYTETFGNCKSVCLEIGYIVIQTAEAQLAGAVEYTNCISAEV